MNLELSPNIDPKAQKDILELNNKITSFQLGEIPDEKFRSFRLTRGVYGQRQLGVQMIRIKLPYGKLSSEQLLRIADVCEEYASGVLHATTRQDIQIHHVKLAKTPEVWAKLEEKQVTLREACGNTVRNVTASAFAGIDKDEPFDVTNYADSFYKYFLRNPICQDMGRKFKVAFSSSDKDSAYSWFHDLGFIPKVKTENGIEKRGFKVLLGGGLGAQPFLAHEINDFMPVEEIIPFTEGVIRVFDRYGERTRRHKARIKYLIHDLGLEKFLALVKEESASLKNHSFEIDGQELKPVFVSAIQTGNQEIKDTEKYRHWLKSNVFAQKQDSYFAVAVKLPLGNMDVKTARDFAAIFPKYAADDVRVTVNQGYLLRFVKETSLKGLFNELNLIGLAEPGFDSTADITACPGTDTCNLGIASSYGLALELERLIKADFKELIFNTDIKIKISGCMNACGQHSAANIGFHGMSLKVGEQVVPAMQVLLGGGILGDGKGVVADKVIKLPSKRIPDAFRALMYDFEENTLDGEMFNDYFQRQGNKYVYNLLKPYASTSDITQDFYTDWGNEVKYVTEVGVGECAGVMLDLVQVLLNESYEKLENAQLSLQANDFADSVYHSYSTFINGAKALLLTKDVQCNTQHGIINDFDKNFIETGDINLGVSFKDLVMKINQNEPEKTFANEYAQQAKNFLEKLSNYRQEAVQTKPVLV